MAEGEGIVRDQSHAASVAAPAIPAWLALLAICIAGFNMRPAISSLAPVLGLVRQSTGLSSAAAGVLTTLPVVCFGLFAPLAPLLGRRMAPERIIVAALSILGAGILARALFGIPGLFIGSVIAGASISVVMVLLPGIIKRDFARHASNMTGLYTMTLCVGAAVAAGATVPITQAAGGGWRVGLGFWLVPALLAAMCWVPLARGRAALGGSGPARAMGLRRSALAWQVTVYMGSQSALAYVVFGWLPTILIDRGMAPLQAGLVLSVSILLQAVTALAGPWLATRGRDQRPAILLMMFCTAAGLIGCLYAPLSQVWPWAVLLGLGQGGAFSVALMLLVLRAPTPQVAASLSGMAQGVGYTGAALGPLAVGLLHDWTHDWHAVAVFCMMVCVLAIAAGLLAGRDRLIRIDNPGVRS